MISHINKLRNNKPFYEYTESGAIFITETRKVQEYSRKMVDLISNEISSEKKMVGYAISMGMITNILWYKLSKGFGNNDFPQNINSVLKAKIVLSNLISQNVSKKFDECKQAYQKGELDEQQLAARLLALREKAVKPEGRISMLIVDKLAFQEKLSEGEKTLAAYILAHGMEIAKYSTRSLAEVTYTSPPTVLRLCKKLGFTGFDDFKQNFVRELEYLDQQQGKVDFNFPFAENDSPMRVAQNIGELYEEAVKDTMQLLRYEDLHKAVLLLKYHEEIHIFSAGTAINQAESFREKMLKIGKRVVIFNNLNYQRYQACCLTERDLAMIISYSGETAQMLEIARQCKRSGTPILALTSFGENSLTCYADCKLTLSTKESIYQNLGDYASHLSMTLLLDILYSEYFRQNYQKNYTYKLERARELEQHRTSTNPILLNLHKENAE